MVFNSILFLRAEDGAIAENAEPPAFFADLNIDRIVEAVTAVKPEYNLKPFYYRVLDNADDILYRYEIMRDLENPALMEHINFFSQGMAKMRRQLAQAEKLYYKLQRQRWFVDVVETYCETITRLAADLQAVGLNSRGFLAFRRYLLNYVDSDAFKLLVDKTLKIKESLATVKYCLAIKESLIKVSKYNDEADYSAEVEAIFAKFKYETVKEYRFKFAEWTEMNHVEAEILEHVAKLYPEVFQELENYCEETADYLDKKIAGFDREVQFYVAFLEYAAKFKQAGLNFCCPEILNKSKQVYACQTFDLALAGKLLDEQSDVVTNDFYLGDGERIFVVSGPNQGGKTTFARTFGQLHYLAGIGCPVPGVKAGLVKFDQMFTHFEKEEDITNLRGKLKDDLVRIRGILDRATPDSIIIMNEIFNSTTLADAIYLSRKIMERIINLDLLCVCVTFIEELTTLSNTIVSMVSTVDPANPAVRTYKIIRRPADGRLYAISVAEKYRLTYNSLKERILR